VSQEHDPELYVSYLRQCLSEGDRPIGVFLGAGCPTAVTVSRGGKDEPLIPDISGMTARIQQILERSAIKDSYAKLCDHFERDGVTRPNVEGLLTHVRSLMQVVGKDEVRGLSAAELEALEGLICDSLVEIAQCSLPRAGTPFHQLAVWVGAIHRAQPVEIFTTNYDLLIEEALEFHRVAYFDGFVGTNSAFLDLQAMEEDKLPSRWARLWKIHGSLNWFQESDGSVHRGRVRSGERRVIYPSHLKYDESRRMPHLAMIDRLRAFLRNKACVLVTCGYSFGDDHLNEVFTQGLQGNSTASMFALLFGEINDYPSLAKLAATRANLNAFGRDAAIIGTRSAAWTGGKSATGTCDSIAVKWLADAANPGARNASFTLGDFARFAEFIEDLTGERQRSIGA
jgi:hypothetical protein